MKQKTKFQIAALSTLGGALVNLYDSIHNELLYHVTQKLLESQYGTSTLIEIHNVKNNFDFSQWSDYLSKSVQRTSYIEFGSAALLAGLSYYFYKKSKKLDDLENRLSLDID